MMDNMDYDRYNFKKDIKTFFQELGWWLAIVLMFVGCMAFLFYCGGPGLGI